MIDPSELFNIFISMVKGLFFPIIVAIIVKYLNKSHSLYKSDRLIEYYFSNVLNLVLNIFPILIAVNVFINVIKEKGSVIIGALCIIIILIIVNFFLNRLLIKGMINSLVLFKHSGEDEFSVLLKGEHNLIKNAVVYGDSNYYSRYVNDWSISKPRYTNDKHMVVTKLVKSELIDGQIKYIERYNPLGLLKIKDCIGYFILDVVLYIVFLIFIFYLNHQNYILHITVYLISTLLASYIIKLVLLSRLTKYNNYIKTVLIKKLNKLN
ncbi:hypothetical protein NZD48_01360 [Staphylococcus hyicus]|uniref:hypothetical protein n=1 Tax=Staphylococcus hyicus TaxID=1284 RepID=UPI00217D7BB0|nr:hypothetical protein [Staphylococcus hyicus]UWF57031.1 hypothetical protein NZD48_01360 [Staphylococcus hyicus]